MRSGAAQARPALEPLPFAAMPHISREEVLRMAKLARLRLSDPEVRAMTRDLEAILSYVEQLQAVEPSDVIPTAHAIPLATPLRRDEPEGDLDPDLALANAPARQGTAFAVPKVLGTEEEG